MKNLAPSTPLDRYNRRQLRIKRGLLIILVLGAALLSVNCVTGCASTGSTIQNPPPAVRMVEEK